MRKIFLGLTVLFLNGWLVASPGSNQPRSFLGQLEYVTDTAGYNVGYKVLINPTEGARVLLSNKSRQEKVWLNGNEVSVQDITLLAPSVSPIEIETIQITVRGSINHAEGDPMYGVLSLDRSPGQPWVRSDPSLPLTKGKDRFLWVNYDGMNESEDEGEYSTFIGLILKESNGKWTEAKRITSYGLPAIPLTDTDGDGFPEFLISTGKYSKTLIQVFPSQIEIARFDAE